MSDENKVRLAHDVLDGLFSGRILSQENEQLLRSFLPERPKPVTLADLLDRVHDAWISANPSDWGFDTPAEHHDWLFDLRNDLVRIIEEQDTPAAEPENVAATVHSLPAGMRLADHERHGRVVAAPVTDGDGRRMIFCLDNTSTAEAGRRWVRASSLTFIDAEPAKSAHPEFLETEANYQNAPAGTVAAKDGWLAWIKQKNGDWSCDGGSEGGSILAQTGKRRVLRWGWTNE